MTSLKISKGQFPKTVHLPSSKSYANRALIMGALKDQAFTISQLPTSTDVTWLISALSNCGLNVQQGDKSVTILNSFPRCEGEGARIEVGEGGTTARFLASMLLRGQAPYTLILGGRLSERPWSEFIDFVRLYGGKAELIGNELHLQGPLQLPQEVEVDCSRTTQFASGLLLAFHKKHKIKPVNLAASRSYWDLTQAMLRTSEDSNVFSVPIDWSGASYPLAFGALNHEISFPGLFYDPYQSDAKFFHLLEKLGAIKQEEQGLRGQPISKSQPIELDVSDCLDLVPALGFFLAHLEGEHRLHNIENLVHKESDRLTELRKLLDAFERPNRVEQGTLFIQGSLELISDSRYLTMPDDHRMVMTAALFLRHHNGGEVSPVQAVDKSYPHFFDMLV